MESVKDEISLVADIIDRLLTVNESLRADQLTPLIKRLRVAADELFRTDQQSKCAFGRSLLSRSGEEFESITSGRRQATSKLHLPKCVTRLPAARQQTRKAHSLSASGKPTVGSNLFISSEVSQPVCCSLYNVLEGATRLLRASHGHIFVKRGDDMYSIANVSRKLTFPPSQVHHRCLGSADTEVLGSTIALNRHIDEVGRKCAILIFPIYNKLPVDNEPGEPVATIHVERKEHAFAPFNKSDECTLYFASLFCSELMSRIPQLNFLESFYDPSTQHIIAPFEPYSPVPMPSLKSGGSPMARGPGKRFTDEPEYAAHAVSQLTRKMNTFSSHIMIRRESLPSSNMKPFAPGMTHMPSLLEIQAYVDSLQSCWKKNMVDNVDLLELDRGSQQELKLARSELAATRRQLAAANDKLRLYELNGCDYKLEYSAMKAELNAYMDGLEHLH
ncbi:hypothetical protein JKF63_00046 [Porcisia hertigi]|uniref:Uncharacterized protein n=1 Tax=Porcisia hertigi TaxID=2761500 RepID=A0A836HCE7_9TRYP|nr:hypothetical protein JKF63_00046 [Porcisia hertigi]